MGLRYTLSVTPFTGKDVQSDREAGQLLFHSLPAEDSSEIHYTEWGGGVSLPPIL